MISQPERLPAEVDIDSSSNAALTIAAAEAKLLRQVSTFTGWVGAEGRKLTQTGRIRLADAHELVALLETGDADPVGGTVRVTSSEELPELTAICEWAKQSRLVRVTRGRLVAVKKNGGLLDRRLELWGRMFEAFPRLGNALCQPGWAESLMRRHFKEAVDAVLEEMYGRGGAERSGSRRLASSRGRR